MNANPSKMNQQKIDKAILDCYIRLYSEADPPADFQELMDNAELNEHGQKIIPYWAHEIDRERESEIIEETAKKHKVPKYLRQAFRNTIMLGVSPKHKPYEDS